MEVWSSCWHLEWLFNLFFIETATCLPQTYCICYLSGKTLLFWHLKVHLLTFNCNYLKFWTSEKSVVCA